MSPKTSNVRTERRVWRIHATCVHKLDWRAQAGKQAGRQAGRQAGNATARWGRFEAPAAKRDDDATVINGMTTQILCAYVLNA